MVARKEVRTVPPWGQRAGIGMDALQMRLPPRPRGLAEGADAPAPPRASPEGAGPSVRGDRSHVSPLNPSPEACQPLTPPSVLPRNRPHVTLIQKSETPTTWHVSAQRVGNAAPTRVLTWLLFSSHAGADLQKSREIKKVLQSQGSGGHL